MRVRFLAMLAIAFAAFATIILEIGVLFSNRFHPLVYPAMWLGSIAWMLITIKFFKTEWLDGHDRLPPWREKIITLLIGLAGVACTQESIHQGILMTLSQVLNIVGWIILLALIMKWIDQSLDLIKPRDRPDSSAKIPSVR